jgi:putative transposase
MKSTQVARLLAYVTGMVNRQLLLQNEYLLAENRILRAHLPSRLLLTDPERSTLAVIGKRLGRRGLEALAAAAKPDTILAWFRKLVAHKFDGSQHRLYPGRPTIGREITELIVRMARENSGWGYDRIAGALANLGHRVSDQTVGNILRRFGIPPTAKRREQMSWAAFIRSHMAVLAGVDFFTVEVLTWRGLATYYVLFFLHLETRRVTLAGITQHPTEEWMAQMARRAVDDIDGALLPVRFVLHDRDSKFCATFRDTLHSAGIKTLILPAQSPNLNAFAERWVRSVKSECLSKLILFGQMHVACDTCGLLSVSLRNTRDRLEAVISRLAWLCRHDRSKLFTAELHEAQSLRMEWRALKAEVEHHKAPRASTTTQI